MTFRQSPLLPKAPTPITVIGAGAIVRHAHLPAYKLAGFPVHGIYDIDLSRAESLAKEFGIGHVYPNLEQAVSSSPGNIFDLAVPASAIAETLAELPDEAHVLIQKPMGETLTQAETILLVCRQKELHAAVNFQLRTAPYSLAARDIIARGLIGDVLEVDVKVTVQMPWADWSFLELSPRMEIVYHSIHYIDFVRCLLGDPRGVKANTIKHPASPKLHSSRSAVILDYGDYCRAQVVTYHAHDFGSEEQESRIRIEGTEGCIVIQLGLNLDYPAGGPDQLRYVRKGEPWTNVPLEGSWFPHAFIGTMASMQRWAEDPLAIPETEVHNAFHTMLVVEAAYIDAASPGVPMP